MNKRILFAYLILFILSSRTFAQDRTYHFGLHVAPNISWLKPEVEGIDYKSDGSLVGVSYGAVFENDFTPNVGIITGITILHTGGHLQYPFIVDPGGVAPDTGTLWRKYNLQYIELPLILKGSTGDVLGNFSFWGRFGIGNGFRIKAKAKDEFLSDNNPSGEKTVTENKNVKGDVSFFRESLIIGIGAEYRIGNTATVQAGVTFSNGFTDILTSKTSYKSEINEKARSNFVELNIGVMF
jgi:hypothetical protein